MTASPKNSGPPTSLHRGKPLSFRTWDPSNPLHDSILNRDGVVHDAHHGRIDHIFGTARVQKHYHTTNAKMIWDQPVISADAPHPGVKFTPATITVLSFASPRDELPGKHGAFAILQARLVDP